MKLIFKISLLFVGISSLVVLLGALITHRAMVMEIDKEEKWFLEERLNSTVRFLERRMPEHKIVRDKWAVTPLTGPAEPSGPFFSDTLVMHAMIQRPEPHLKLDAVRVINGQAYKIMLFDLIIEEDDIVDAVKASMIKIYVLLLGLSLILSFVASYYVFRPFQHTLAVIRNFSIKQEKVETMQKTSTAEFVKLNLFVEEMMRKAQRDYQALKEFSENASHEIQTPISIAQGKLELLMESSDLSEEQMELISSAEKALKRLSRMSNSLSLLTKIENQEFSDFNSVNVSQLISGLLFDFKELMELKSIQLVAEITPDVHVHGNQSLLEILVTNLLNNAVRHNRRGGVIHVVVDDARLEVSNSGAVFEGNPNELFSRFKKGSENPDSSGLGLSIVKRISEEHHFNINYSVVGEQHYLTVRWPNRD